MSEFRKYYFEIFKTVGILLAYGWPFICLTTLFLVNEAFVKPDSIYVRRYTETPTSTPVNPRLIPLSATPTVNASATATTVPSATKLPRR